MEDELSWKIRIEMQIRDAGFTHLGDWCNFSFGKLYETRGKLHLAVYADMDNGYDFYPEVLLCAYLTTGLREKAACKLMLERVHVDPDKPDFPSVLASFLQRVNEILVGLAEASSVAAMTGGI